MERKYTGWAFDIYPDKDDDYYEREIDRQLEFGANFIWIGHNNPGEVRKNTGEPGLSYAVYEAFLNKNDPRHSIARNVISAQKRFLNICLKKNVPIVFPVGYQIQMGEIWNEAHPNDLRRGFEGKIINWGGVSASFYSKQYQDDIRVFYNWVSEEWIKPFKKIILMVNLSDEPFGGDYSECANKAFKELTGLDLKEAASGSVENKRKLGDFQSNYIVEYARWSAKVWEEICPDIPCTMSFCGMHGREENTMPSVPALFKTTPGNFYPTFDVYPRDGTSENPITEADVSMLLIFLRQIAYLSRNNNKPYWLWTTGNSWGLGQASNDKANISDCIANQFYTVSTALENNGLLNGIAVWNYNIRNQGLYDDPNPIIYDPDKLFEKATGVLKVLREEMESAKSKNFFRTPSYALYLSRDYSNKCIGSSKLSVWVRSFNFSQMNFIAKEGANLIADDSIDSITDYYENQKAGFAEKLLFLTDSDEKIASSNGTILSKLLEKASHILVSEKLVSRLSPYFAEKSNLSKNISTYSCFPYELQEEFLRTQLSAEKDNQLYIIWLGDLAMLYNLSGKTQNIDTEKFSKDSILYIIGENGILKSAIHLSNSKNSDQPTLKHHEIAFLAKENNELMKKLIKVMQ